MPRLLRLYAERHLALSSSRLSSVKGTMYVSEGHFQRAVGPILLIGQLFGVMPVIGVTGHSVSDLHFKWKSARTIYSLIMALILVSLTISFMWTRIADGFHLNLFASIMFFLTNTTGYISFFVLAWQWPELMQHWHKVEAKYPTFRNQKWTKIYELNIRFTAFTILLFALVEHLLFNGSDNAKGFNWEIHTKFMSLYETFVWNYVDIFIMIVSLGLSTHFKLLNNQLKRAKVQNMSQDMWIHLRKEYANACNLVAKVDAKIAHIILLSVFNNLFIICKQLYLSFRPFPTLYHMFYFWFSLIFLIVRIFVVTLLAARINDESKKPAKFLCLVSPDSGNTELERILHMAVHQKIALSGMKYFYLTRKFMLSAVATIITYELVLIQFHVDLFI